jgi:hypothetical protein
VITHGGRIAASVTRAVTHVVSNSVGSGKTSKAQQSGIPVVTEEWVTASVRDGKMSTHAAHFAFNPSGVGERRPVHRPRHHPNPNRPRLVPQPHRQRKRAQGKGRRKATTTMRMRRMGSRRTAAATTTTMTMTNLRR